MRDALIAHIAELWRYPIKSMGGERCVSLDLTAAGLGGDRQLAFESADAPKGKPLLRAAARAAMLRLRATTDESGTVLIHVPGHPVRSADDPNLSQQLASDLDLAATSALTLVRSPRPLTDVRPVSLHSVQTVRQLAAELDAARLPGLSNGFDPRRLRSNIVLDVTSGVPFSEDLLAGRTLQIGDTLRDQMSDTSNDPHGSPARLRVTERIPRCRIVSLAPESAAHDPTLLRHLGREHGGRVGMYARPLTPGTLRVGDPVFLL